MENQGQEKQVHRLIGEPIFNSLPERALKIKKSLLLVSFITLFVIWSDIQINPASPFFGINFIGLSQGDIYAGLAIIDWYFFIYFCINARNTLREWRVRVTGINLIYRNGAGSSKAEIAEPYADYPNSHRQLSLYSWWVDELPKIRSFMEVANRIEDSLNKVNESISEKSPDVNFNNNNPLIQSIHGVNGGIADLKEIIREVLRIIGNTLISDSLAKFDNAFKLLLKGQNLRCCIFELMVPFLMGFSACIWVAIKAFCLCWPETYLYCELQSNLW